MSRETLALTEALTDYIRTVGVPEHPVATRLRADTASMEEANMQLSAEQGRFLAFLVTLTGARRCVEIGTFTGYSSLVTALALPADGALLCCDVSDEWTGMARNAWAEAGVADKITLQIAPALETLDAKLAEGWAGTVDLMFVDADKESYPAYLDRASTLLRPGGVLAFDNVLWGGSVADPTDRKETTVAIRETNKAIADHPDLFHVLLPVGDGMMLAVKTA
ncbi:MAG: class I SAM-dependent methyltransferase [Alphaproteobacteria bacterium]|nr:class I SAM-dependent methyltransferase [Alphaproteobacteria bacterium]